MILFVEYTEANEALRQELHENKNSIKRIENLRQHTDHTSGAKLQNYLEQEKK